MTDPRWDYRLIRVDKMDPELSRGGVALNNANDYSQHSDVILALKRLKSHETELFVHVKNNKIIKAQHCWSFMKGTIPGDRWFPRTKGR